MRKQLKHTDLAGGWVTFFSEFPKKNHFALLKCQMVAICSSATHAEKFAEKCAEKVAKKVAEKSAEKFSAYNSTILRPWHEPFGRPFQTRHTDPSPDAALVRESLISVEAPNLLSVQTCFNSKLSAKHVSHTHVKMATLMRQNFWKHFGPQKFQTRVFSKPWQRCLKGTLER